jgi:hypothetical protein
MEPVSRRYVDPGPAVLLPGLSAVALLRHPRSSGAIAAHCTTSAAPRTRCSPRRQTPPPGRHRRKRARDRLRPGQRQNIQRQHRRYSRRRRNCDRIQTDCRITPITSNCAGLLPARNRPANRAATFPRHTEAIERLKQKRMLPHFGPRFVSCSSGRLYARALVR